MKWKKRQHHSKPRSNDSIIEKLARIRGIESVEDFLKPRKKFLNSPYLLDNIEKVAERIRKAVMKNQRICISADCDTDGISSTAMMYNYLSNFTDNVYYIYNQRSNGHGVENQLDFVQDDTDLIIILDSSTNSVEACKKLTERGIDVLILDHHSIEKENPYATIVNPQGDNYPNKEISGAGVTLKALQVLDNLFDVELSNDYLDLCAVGMYGDMMNVSVGENRYIIMNGMKKINNQGLQSLLDLKKVDQVNSSAIAFSISPLLNGCARMDKIELALELLTTDNPMSCALTAKEMSDLNEERKKKEKKLVDKYKKKINEDDKVIIAIDKSASKGFNGLVATKLSKEYQRPALVLRDHNGTLAGSFRTYGNFDMQKFLRKAKKEEGIEISAEGHTFAGGVSFDKKDLGKLNKYINNKLKNKTFETILEYDLEIDSSEINGGFIKEVERFNFLTGQGMPEAKFRIKNLNVDERIVIGKNKDTIKIICDELTALKFKVDSDYGSEIEDMDTIEVIGSLNINKWYNWKERRTIVTNQTLIEDYRITDSMFESNIFDE